MENRAIKIEYQDWPKLRKLYLPERPETILGLCTLSNYIRWHEKQSSIESLAIYSLNGDWSDGTFVVVDRYHLYCDSLSESIGRLKMLLDLLDYSDGVRVMHVRSKCYPAVIETFKRKQLQLEFDDPNLLYYLPKEQAVTFNIKLPDGFECRSLTDSDVIISNAAWKFNHPGSLFYLQRLARLNSCFGIFTTNENELVSSGFETQTGVVGTLYTNPAYRNRGLGTLMAKIICKKIGESGRGVVACVKRENLPSRAIFEKIGCQIVDTVQWLSMECTWTDETDFILK